jgi:hypothetical protein
MWDYTPSQIGSVPVRGFDEAGVRLTFSGVMKATLRAQRAVIQKIKRENEEQCLTIENLWAALNLPGKPPHSATPAESPESIRGAEPAPEIKDELTPQIAKLESILRQKKHAYESLEAQVTDYVRKAEMYEQELIKNEEEKAQLLLSFRKVAEPSTGSVMTLDELDSRVENPRQGLQEPLTLAEMLSMKKAVVEDLQAKLNGQLKTIRNLREDNQLLEAALMTIDSSSMLVA